MNHVKGLLSRNPHFTVLTLLTASTLLVLISILGGRFLSSNNLQSMGTQVAEFGLLALAMGLSMLLGGIDLSIVSAAVLSGIVGAKFLSGDIIEITSGNETMVLIIGSIAILITGMLCGLLNGFLVAKVSIPPILATLATLIFFSGIGMVITNGQSVPVEIQDFSMLGISTVAYVPMVFILMLVVFIAIGFFLQRTRTGRRFYLYGENNVALRFTGVRNERVVMTTYILIGLIVGLAGLIMVSRVNSARVGFGESYLLQAILVVVLAGFNPYGGHGKVGSLLLGLVLLQSLSSAFTIMRFDPFMKTFIWGASLLIIMLINRIITLQTQRRHHRRPPKSRDTSSSPPSSSQPETVSV